MALELIDRARLWTPSGFCNIELLCGDITMLPKEDSVDIIIISAFTGDYSKMYGTVIGALHRNLGIDVKNLAKDKEMDLRLKFSCWLSKPIPEDLNAPYQKVLCFEMMRVTSTSEQIRAMFRGINAVFSNKATSFITPLLATGNQRKSKSDVMLAMFNSVAFWAMAGLPITCFKIVVYDKSENEAMVKTFSSLKEKFEKKSQEKQHQHFYRDTDFLILFDANDEIWASKIEKDLTKVRKNSIVKKIDQSFQNDKFWLKDIAKKMNSSLRTIVILTPYFVENMDCLEQFNMALCLHRCRKGNYLMPFYINTVDTLPIYMTLIQYQDCRKRKETDEVEVKIQNACKILTSGLDKTTDTEEEPMAKKYDIFISYSHKNPELANKLMQTINNADKKLTIFFDRSELTMGSVWQQKLYDALEHARCIVALVSSTYLSSVVCREEYNIALYRQLTEKTSMLFIPILVEETEVQTGFNEIPFIDGIKEKFDSVVKRVAGDLVSWLHDGKETHYHSRCDMNFKDTNFEEYRLSQTPAYKLTDTNKVETCSIVKKNPVTIDTKRWKSRENNEELCDVAVGFGSDCVYCAILLENELKKIIPELKIKFLWEKNERMHHDLDTAKQIVIFLSEDFIRTPSHMQTLHTALCRERSEKNHRIIHLVQAGNIPRHPIFVNLLHINTCYLDKIWSNLHKKAIRGNSNFSISKKFLSHSGELSGTFDTSYANYFATLKVVDDVLQCLHGESNYATPPNLLNVHQLIPGVAIDKGRPNIAVIEDSTQKSNGKRTSKVDDQIQASNDKKIQDGACSEVVGKPVEERPVSKSRTEAKEKSPQHLVASKQEKEKNVSDKKSTSCSIL